MWSTEVEGVSAGVQLGVRPGCMEAAGEGGGQQHNNEEQGGPYAHAQVRNTNFG